MNINVYLLALACTLLAQISVAGSHGHLNTVSRPAFCAEEGMAESNPGCGRTPTATFTPSGDLAIVYVDGAAIRFTISHDMGKHFTPAITVTHGPEKIYADGENRPKIVMGKEGQIFLSWVHRTEGKYTGDIRFSRSLDGGQTFSQPITINDDGLLTSHRFDTLAVGPDGRIHLTWLDKRDLLTAKSRGLEYQGAALYHAISADNGKSFSRNQKIADHSCECCRIALEFDQKGEAIAFWRHVFEGSTRDHAIINLDRISEHRQLHRATFDNWQIKACPHHGPDMAIDTQDNLQLFWFTGAAQRGGLHYARYNRRNGNLDRQLHVDASASASRPQILSQGKRLILSWKVFDGERTKLQLKLSDNEGQSWSETQTLATTPGNSDHPQLFSHQGNTYVSWWTDTQGFQLLAVTGNFE